MATDAQKSKFLDSVTGNTGEEMPSAEMGPLEREMRAEMEARREALKLRLGSSNEPPPKTTGSLAKVDLVKNADREAP